MYKKALLWILFCLALGHALGQDSWTPVVAKQRFKQTLVSQGDRKVLLQTEGLWLRSSSGSQFITTRRVVDGVASDVVTASYYNAVTGEQYDLYYGSKQAYLRGRHKSAPPIPKTAEFMERVKEKALSTRVVNGLFCFEFPVKGAADAAPDVSGRSWMAVEHQIPVRTESNIQTDKGTIEVLREIYDIQLGVEPDTAAMAIPQDFYIIDDVTKVPPINPMTPNEP